MRNFRKLLDFVLYFLRPLLDHPFRHVSGKIKQHYRVFKNQLGDDRFFRISRKSRDGVHLGSDPVQDIVNIIIFFDFDNCGSDIFARGGGVLLYTFKSFYGLFDFLTDSLFNFFWIGSGKGNRYSNHVQRKFRKVFPNHGHDGDTPCQKDQNKYDIGKYCVASKCCYYAFHDCFSLWLLFAISSKAFSSGSISRVMITISPALRPSAT